MDPNWDKRTLIWWSPGRQLHIWMVWQHWIINEYLRLTCKGEIANIEAPKLTLGGLHA